MREYNYSKTWQSLLKPEIVSMLTAIHEYRGKRVEAKLGTDDTKKELIK